MATAADSVKAAGFKRKPKAGLGHHKCGYGVALTGEVDAVSDDDVRRKMWQEYC